jgi:hypothetical protein
MAVTQVSKLFVIDKPAEYQMYTQYL